MRARYGEVVTAIPGSAIVAIDGALVTVPVSGGATLPVGDIATVLHDGTRMIALAAPLNMVYAASFVFAFDRLDMSGNYVWDGTDPYGNAWLTQQLTTGRAVTVWRYSGTPFPLPADDWVPTNTGSIVIVDTRRSPYLFPPVTVATGIVNTGQSSQQGQYTVTCDGSAEWDVPVFAVDPGAGVPVVTRTPTDAVVTPVLATETVTVDGNTGARDANQTVYAYTIDHRGLGAATLTLDWPVNTRTGIGHRLAWNT